MKQDPTFAAAVVTMDDRAMPGNVKNHGQVPRKLKIRRRGGARPLIFTVGHSNHSIGEFLALLKAHGVERLVDVRTIPRSRHNPQFNRDALAAAVRRAHIAYTHLPKLGGLRHAYADSVNTGWQNASFRGYADYMQTLEFAAALARLEKLATHKRCAIMCAEAVPWRCHRSLIADALTVRGYPVEHIMTPTRANLHKLTPFARVRGKRITYPPNRATRAYAAKKRAALTVQGVSENQTANADSSSRKPLLGMTVEGGCAAR